MDGAKWKVRAATEPDLGEMWQIEAACFEAPWSLGLLREALGDPKYLVLCAEETGGAEEPGSGRLLGHALAWSVGDEGQLDRLAVLPSRRREGIGHALLLEVLRGLRRAGAGSVFLEVRAGNASALALYRAAGFALAGARRAYYDDGEDALVLRLDEAP